MSQPVPPLSSEQQFALIDLCRQAGEAILAVYARDDFDIQMKSDDSPLTAADRAAHEILAGNLPTIVDCPVLSEEGAAIDWDTRKTWDLYWLIDPLDGTKEFIKRNGEFTVNVALIHDGKPVFGVVLAPVLGVSYFGGKGLGGWKLALMPDALWPMPNDGESISVGRPPLEGSRPWRIVGSRSHQTDAFLRFAENYPDAEIVSMGSSLKFCLVAEGEADLYPRLGPTSEWDTAAAQAVAEGAGAEVVHVETGEPLRYNQKESLLNPFFIVRAPAGAKV